MIDWNQKDFNINKIRSEGKLGNLITKYPYRIYGLKQTRENLIEIYYNRSRFRLAPLGTLIRVLSDNKIPMSYNAEDDGDKIYIGMRKDLRKHVLYSSALLQTIIYTLEGRLTLVPGQTKFPKLPKLD